MDADERVLDNAAWASLTGHHARFAEGTARALRYRRGVAPFVAVPDEADHRVWGELAALVGPGAVVALNDPPTDPPPEWEVVDKLYGVQLVGTAVAGAPDGEAVRLTTADVPEVLDLVARTKPGPFGPRTLELGTYLGIRRGGRLVAMAGERLHPPGWTEISAVCTDAEFRGQGLATRLILALVNEVKARGEQPVIHAVRHNHTAIRLYESLGFRHRRQREFKHIRVPDAATLAASLDRVNCDLGGLAPA